MEPQQKNCRHPPCERGEPSRRRRRVFLSSPSQRGGARARLRCSPSAARGKMKLVGHRPAVVPPHWAPAHGQRSRDGRKTSNLGCRRWWFGRVLSPLLRRSSVPEQPANQSRQSNKRRNHPIIARNPTHTHRNHARARPVNERSPHPPPTQPVFFFSRLTPTRPPKPGWPPRRKPWTTTLPRDLGRLRYVAASGCRAGGKSRALLSLALVAPTHSLPKRPRARPTRLPLRGARWPSGHSGPG